MKLHPNTPNPFNPTTSIRYDIPVSCHVNIVVYNAKGNRVRTIVSSKHKQNPGRYTVSWSGKDDAGKPVATGIYFYRIKAGKFNALRKMILLK